MGITNAAVWFGSALFLLVAVGPSFASPEMARLLPAPHRGAAAQVVLERYFVVQYWCGGIALAHLLLEKLYAGKAVRGWILYWILGIVLLDLLSGLLVEPKVRGLHLEVYGTRSTSQQRQQARVEVGFWQSVIRVSNVIVVAGLWIYLWEVTSPGGTSRFVGGGKFRG